MHKPQYRVAAALAALLLPLPALAQPLDPAALRDAALQDTLAWDFIEGITTEVGPRPAGTPAEARGRAWAEAWLKAQGFANVRIEPYMMPVWLRGDERAEVTGPFPQKLTVTALGNSGATGPKGVEAEVVMFASLDALKAAPDAAVKGKIVFITHRMTATQDGSSYGAFGPVRTQGPNVAAKKGAAAIVIRSIGTDYHRTPHTGNTRFEEGVAPIPAGALSVPDAEQLERIVARGKPVTLRLTLTPSTVKQAESGNVIAEVPGSDPAAGIVVVACHLDSWDLGTGAIDDAAGCGIVAAAARRIQQAGTPRRTIRILFAGSEEVGAFGAKAYFEAHKSERHATASESDFGADRIWKVEFNLPENARAVGDRVAAALLPLGIARGPAIGGDGTDIAPLHRAGVAAIDLAQSGSRYFDLHHTADDTLDKIDPAQLRQNVAAWTAMLAVVADAHEDIGPVTPRP
ncbi:M20/M25/M40 family metallo-hydrolase [Sphingomonas canadensis]|uniref:Carboxypeptidase Q n=1 Tax=Sphingomonas canadensis TaxID=1219257 RepID=A0ABW3HBY7_9SPHN|nr:M20/M25/M40 family metallo-hydrolase [Sphingomonas canadensis]MCW3836878.1 M20/M25/M40 family metallo-hydrolase [Sphingomonas canadensis]